jgi:hypothetical protein
LKPLVSGATTATEIPYRQPCPSVLVPLLVVLLAYISGCGASLPATVEGTITLDGKPLPSGELIFGTVAFYPVGAGATAYGTIENSKFTLQTGDSSGLQTGEYRIGIRLVETAAAPPGGYQNAPAQKSLIPPHYDDPEQSGLNFVVGKGKNECALELKSSAKP